MAQDGQRTGGRPVNYKLDRGGVPAEGGPFYGIVKNNVDPARTGRLQVFIQAFGALDEDDDSKWVTVSYLPQFFGSTQQVSGTTAEDGTFPGNPTSYGMWFTPPDVGITVVCVFINGDRSQGYYIGVVPDQGVGHMVPAIGAESNYVTANANQAAYYTDAARLPVTEINVLNLSKAQSSRYFDQSKPVQSTVAAEMFQQGISTDNERGPINSSSQRETPSNCYGISTPGTPIYQGGMKPVDIRQKLNDQTLKPKDVQVIGRTGGHTLVMDDGDLEGKTQLFRLRSAKGHQITMNDTENFLYIIHANGQTWMEFGKEGTVDIYSTNSVNLRTQGDINLHADRDINMYAGRNFNIRAKENVQIEAGEDLTAMATNNMTLYGSATIGVKTDGTLALDSPTGGSWNGGASLTFTAGGIDLNGPAAAEVDEPAPLETTILSDTEFKNSTGWQVVYDGLESICSRAPTHEPYPYHNLGVDVETDFSDPEADPEPPPGAEPVPAGFSIEAE